MQLAPLDNSVVTITPAERAAIMDEREWEAKLQQSANKGRDEGIEIGRQTEWVEIARSMLAAGMDAEIVIQFTGLSKAEVTTVQNR